MRFSQEVRVFTFTILCTIGIMVYPMIHPIKQEAQSKPAYIYEGIESGNKIRSTDAYFLNLLDSLYAVKSIPFIETNLKELNSFSSNFDSLRIGENYYYLLGGDLLMTRNQIGMFAKGYKHRLRKNKSDTLPATKYLTVVTDESQTRILNKWQSREVRFGILRNSFLKREREVVKDAIINAARDWMEVCGVRFVYDSAYDNRGPNPKFPYGSLSFMVKFENHEKPGILATAFLGRDLPEKRFIRIDSEFFTQTTYDQIGILRHELGHVMGFLHEHISPKMPLTCTNLEKEKIKWNHIYSQYDSLSCMHYLCRASNGEIIAGTRDLEISSIDSSVANIFYGPPN